MIRGGFEQGLALDVAYFNRGLAYRRTGSDDLAIADFTQALAAQPTDANALFARGTLLLERGEMDGAIDDFGRVVGLDARAAPAFAGRGAAYARKGDADRAIADLTRAITIDAGIAAAYFQRGLLHQAAGRSEPALADLTAYVRLAPADVNGFERRGDIYFTTGDFDWALSDFAQAVRLDAGNAPALYGRGMAKRAQAAFAAGDADILAARRLRPDVETVMAARGVVPPRPAPLPVPADPPAGASAPAPRTAGAGPGMIRVLCDRDCAIAVDGEAAGTLAAGQGVSVSVPFGQHLVSASGDGVNWEQIVDVPTEAQVVVRTDLTLAVQTRDRADAQRRQQAEQVRLEQQRREEDARQAEIRRQQEVEQRRIEAERLAAQEQARREAAARFFASVAGTWTHASDDRSANSRVQIEDVATIDTNGSGVRVRTTTRYERGFAGWRKTSTDQSRDTFRCDGEGALSGALSGRVTVGDANAIYIGGDSYSRR